VARWPTAVGPLMQEFLQSQNNCTKCKNEQTDFGGAHYFQEFRVKKTLPQVKDELSFEKISENIYNLSYNIVNIIHNIVATSV
jgi:hypothetical protein